MVQICLPPPERDIPLESDHDIRTFIEWWFDLSDQPEELVAVSLDDDRRILAVTDFEDVVDPRWIEEVPHAPFLAAQATESSFVVVASKRPFGGEALTAAERRARDAAALHGESVGIELLDWVVVLDAP
jgi:hypothetical protein